MPGPVRTVVTPSPTPTAVRRAGRPPVGNDLIRLHDVGHVYDARTPWAHRALAGIDPFGQPGVEEGKRLAWGLMGRPGFEASRAEVEAWLARKDARFVI